jgi:DNA-binding NarL/FixJ family response regulator
MLPKAPPDVVLMDIGLPGISGIECICTLKPIIPKTQIMMLTVFEDDQRIFQSLAAGATAYLVKKTPPAKLLEAITDLHAGGSPMSNQIARRLVGEFQKSKSHASETEGLSPRETEVLHLLAKGFLYKEIAAQLCISQQTVRTHLRNIYEKLQVRTRTEAVIKALHR